MDGLAVDGPVFRDKEHREQEESSVESETAYRYQEVGCCLYVCLWWWCCACRCDCRLSIVKQALCRGNAKQNILILPRNYFRALICMMLRRNRKARRRNISRHQFASRIASPADVEYIQGKQLHHIDARHLFQQIIQHSTAAQADVSPKLPCPVSEACWANAFSPSPVHPQS